MRRTDVLIREARRISRNEANPDGTYAISDDEIVQYLNDAQDRMQNLISAEKNISKIFVTQQIISIVAGQESYSITDRVLLNKQIEGIEFSFTGNASDYVQMEKLNFINRDTNSSNYPWGYIKRGGSILLQPTPSVSSGTIRVTYERDLDDLDIPRALVSTITGGTATQFTTLTLSALANSYESTSPGWSNIQFFSVVDPFGVRRCYNIPVASYDTGTNIVTPSPSPYVYTAYDSAIQANDVCVFNKYTTTFSQLPDGCERYLIHYAANELFAKDSSNDTSRHQDMLGAMEQDILKALKAQTSEIQYIPQNDRYDWW